MGDDGGHDREVAFAHPTLSVRPEEASRRGTVSFVPVHMPGFCFSLFYRVSIIKDFQPKSYKYDLPVICIFAQIRQNH